MQLCTGQQVMNSAFEYAVRTRDKLNPQEQTMVQGFIADEFGELWDAQYWPELIGPFYNVSGIVGRTFSKNQGQANPPPPEMGAILTITSQDPRATDFYTNLDWDEGDNTVILDSRLSNVWVEYLPPYPGVLWPDLDPGVMNLAAFVAAPIPYRFKKILAHRAAAHLLNAELNAAAAGVQFGLAEKAYMNQLTKLPPPPEWRRIRVKRGYGRRSHGVPPVWSGALAP